MICKTYFTAALLLPFTLHTIQPCVAEEATSGKTKPLIDLKSPILEKQVKPTSGQVTYTRSEDPAAPAIVVKIQPGEEGYPRLHITPEAETWDLS